MHHKRKKMEDLNKIYQVFNDYFSNIDCFPKNQYFQYDNDTTLGIPNDFNEDIIDTYWYDKQGYCDYEYDIMYTSTKHFGPRGECYYLVLVKNNKIIAFGDEQGNYAGGIYAANDFNYERFLNEKDSLKEEYPELYDKIKDIPLAEKNEYPRYKIKF